MREQLQMKKQKMIDELRELRKEYALDKEKSGEDALSNYEHYDLRSAQGKVPKDFTNKDEQYLKPQRRLWVEAQRSTLAS